MISDTNRDGRRWHVVQSPEELPDLTGGKELWMDVETNGLYPWSAQHGHRMCGIAATVDDANEAWYVPFRHRDGRWNIPLSAATAWMQRGLPKRATWANANVKFDARHMLHDGYVHEGAMHDTTVAAKLHDSDRFTYHLKDIGKDWLGREADERDKIREYLDGLKKAWQRSARKVADRGREPDYSDIPADLLGEYACQDVFLNRDVQRHCDKNRPADVEPVWRLETKLTPVLFDMEREGMRVDRMQLRLAEARCLRRLIEIQERLEHLIGREYVDSAQSNHDVICNQLGLPVLARQGESQELTFDGFDPADGEREDGEPESPSFDKHALARYAVHPDVLGSERAKETIELIIENRRENHFLTLFIRVFNEHMDGGGVLHPDYNQVVRTGRTSCRKPNAQQMSKRAKQLIVPPEGMRILSADASQIEFRIIVHYIQDKAAIAAYLADPRTDFHQWVADQIGIERKPAKNVNFATGYGAGRRKVTSMVAANPVIMERVGKRVNEMIADGQLREHERDQAYRRMCRIIAERIYEDYHARFPGIRTLTRIAEGRCRQRGWVMTAFGRRRHLGPRAAHRAFNAAVQGTAMDYIKTRMVALAPRYNDWARDVGLRPSQCVHDELTWHVPAGVAADPAVRAEIERMLEVQEVQFRVPFVWEMGVGSTWAEAAGDAVLSDSGEWIAGRVAA